jgi:lipid-A-disaccharide synthase
MRIFICAGEPSGDLHGANLVQTLKRRQPGVECVGFGGDRMAAAGCNLLYPLCHLAVMGIMRVVANAPAFLNLLSRADRYFRHQRPDAVVLIDYPGFNWWLARRAQQHGIPVYYFVPPQIWAWASWRVKKMQRFVDHVLCSLPFEEAWYREHGVQARFVGHPYFDELAEYRPDESFVAEEKQKPGTVVALLPGSREHEVKDNLATLVRTAQLIHRDRPETRFLVACYKPAQQQRAQEYLRGMDLPIETHHGRTQEIIQLAHACVAVSGSVGLELLYHRKPSVVVYRVSRLNLFLVRRLMKSRFISIVNLLADKELFPEYLTDQCPAEAISGHVLNWLNEPARHADLVAELTDLRQRVAAPGACERAAEFILALQKQALAA